MGETTLHTCAHGNSVSGACVVCEAVQYAAALASMTLQRDDLTRQLSASDEELRRHGDALREVTRQRDNAVAAAEGVARARDLAQRERDEAARSLAETTAMERDTAIENLRLENERADRWRARAEKAEGLLARWVEWYRRRFSSDADYLKRNWAQITEGLLLDTRAALPPAPEEKEGAR